MPSKQVFYHPLVRWNVLDEIVFLTEPHQHTQVREMMMQALDHAVLEAALEDLSREEQTAFLELCKDNFHDESLLEWLEERSTDISDKLRGIIQDTKQEIRSLLEANDHN